MREYLSSIEPEDYDQVIYPQLVMGYMVGQKDMFSDDILISESPEKFQPKPKEEPLPKPRPHFHPLQGTFQLPTPYDGKIPL